MTGRRGEEGTRVEPIKGAKEEQGRGRKEERLKGRREGGRKNYSQERPIPGW